MESFQSHRLAYIVLNNQDLKPKKMIIVPYLHERKIYLNRMKQNTNYFYSSKQVEFEEKIKTQLFAFNITEHKFYVYSEKGLLLNRIDYSDKIK